MFPEVQNYVESNPKKDVRVTSEDISKSFERERQ